MGNLLYGYIGSAVGYPKQVLLGGSIYASGVSDFAFNSELRVSEYSDWEYIQQGINWYNNGSIK